MHACIEHASPALSFKRSFKAVFGGHDVCGCHALVVGFGHIGTVVFEKLENVETCCTG